MSESIAVTTPEGIHMFRLLSLKGRLKLEIRGMKFSIRTGPAVKKMFGLPKGCSLKKALAALETEIERLQNEREHERTMQEGQRYQEACERGKLDV
jgi:hypothetical protein